MDRGSPCKWLVSGFDSPAVHSSSIILTFHSILEGCEMAAETTTRAYTLRLSEDHESKWRDHLWTTHCTINRGVWVWGDWLLTLRGGLPASLADGRPERRPILALSWLSVESPRSLVPSFVTDSDNPEMRAEAVLKRFRKILKDIGVDDPNDWEEACAPALTARIRDDARWVDRYECFHKLAKKFKGDLSPEWAAATFFDLIGGEAEYFSMPDVESEVVAEAKDFVIKAGNWLSANWGSGVKSDSGLIAEGLTKLISVRSERVAGRKSSSVLASLIRSLGGDADDGDDVQLLEKQLKQAVGWKGRPSKGAMALAKLAAAGSVTKDLWTDVRKKLQEEAADQLTKSGGASVPDWMPRLRREIESRIGMPFRTTKDHIWEYAVMLDHALRRVSAAHTWIKRAEARRRQFQEAAADIGMVSPPAQEWLDDYCELRSGESGAAFEYLIRRRALDGWEEILRKWKKCKGHGERIAAARDVQKNWPESKKFGDIQLFAGYGDADAREELPFPSLADDDAEPVWKNKKGDWDSSVLAKYVAARQAQHDQRRFKVPAYRHPDPLRHPVWVDFGNSRWNIGYSALERVRGRAKLQEKMKKAKTDAARQKISQQLAESPEWNRVTLGLWTGEAIEPIGLRWHGKRLRNDLGMDDLGQAGVWVPRADRFGRAAAGGPESKIKVAEVFDQKDWSGRLQAKRAELDRLADLIYGKKQPPTYEKLAPPWPEQARKRWDYLRWLLSNSAKLRPAGPWLEFVESDVFKASGWQWVKGRNEHFLKHPANEGRKGRTRLMLARLPGLRVLSFDLGHRKAAACAVWHTMSRENFKKEVAGREVVAGGTKPKDLYLHTRHKDGNGKPRTSVYRRIGADESNAPWTRLDRQFVIKLQGEERRARAATPDEIRQLESHFQILGRKEVEKIHHGRRIDEVMSSTVRETRHALRRHGDVARIANAFQSSVKQLAGGRVYHFFEPNPQPGDSPEKRAENHRQFLLDALVTWHESKDNRTWAHGELQALWTKHIEPMLTSAMLPAEAEEESRADKKRRLKSVEEQLKDVALRLADDAKLRATLASEFNSVWESKDAEWRSKNGHLRWLRSLILPRIGPKPDGASPKFPDWKNRLRDLRNVGGLSIERLSTILMLYQVLRAFHSRPEPANLRAGIERIEAEADKGHRFGQRILDVLERLRQNRIKQLSSRLVEAALGVGSENRTKHWQGNRQTKRPRRRIDEPQFAPCHVIVAENLENYRPEQSRLRSENRRLRDWAARNVRKYIMEGCQLNGLQFDEVSAGYTSRQDSRTGAPGVRCCDILRAEFVKRIDMQAAAKRFEDGGDAARDQYIAKLLKQSAVPAEDRNHSTTVRVPIGGGELFVSADPNSPAAKGIQADLNAAANIGLKALVDPDWPGAWWYVPVKPKEGRADPKDFPACPLFEQAVQLMPQQAVSALESDGEKAGRKAREKVNVWSDVSSDPIEDRRYAWMVTPAYWKTVEKRVISRVLALQFELSVEHD